MSRYAIQTCRVLVVNHSPDRLAAPHVDRRRTGARGTGEIESCLIHPQRDMQFVSNEFVQRCLRYRLDDPADEHRVEVAVLNTGSRTPSKRLGHHKLTSIFRIVGERVERQERTQPRSVRQQMAHGNSVLAFPYEPGQVIADWTIEIDQAAIHEKHDSGRRGNNFRK